MLNFYPGPSKLDSRIDEYFKEAIESGILERNHRSNDFEALYKEVKKLFHLKLLMPSNYELLFLSSATEAWEVISQSFVKHSSIHVFNGAFGEKWNHYAEQIKPNTRAYKYDRKDKPQYLDKEENPELIALTHNETSNGTILPTTFQRNIREKHLNSLIAYDVTSSLSGLEVRWELGDIWFASVQKCFGLPPGLGVLIVSPRAILKAYELNENQHYNSFILMHKNALKWQTHYTPNLTNIFLLKKVLENRDSILEINKKSLDRAQYIYQSVANFNSINLLVEDEDLRSPTVICLKLDPLFISKLKDDAIQQGILLGSGYGELKETTIRIANFPAIADQDFERLIIFLTDFDKKY